MVEPIEETALERNHIVGKLNYSTVEKCKVMEFDTHFDFPVVGQTHTLYIAKKENVLYRWDDTDATSGSYDDLKNKPTIPNITVDTALSKTSNNAIANKAVKDSLYFYVGNTAPTDPIENMVWLNPSELEQTVIDLSSCVRSVNGTQPDGNGNVAVEKVASADKATADGKGNVIADTYNTKTQAQSDMSTLQSSLEAKITALSNELSTYKTTVNNLLLKLRKATYPVSGKQNNFLRGDGTWSEVPTYPLATTSRDGLLSAEDKQKLDTISSDAASVKFIVYS